MTIPIEIIVVGLGAMVALQAWILVEIVALKVRLGNYDAMTERVDKHEARLTKMETYLQLEEK